MYKFYKLTLVLTTIFVNEMKSAVLKVLKSH